jgi:hypothetical protein
MRYPMRDAGLWEMYAYEIAVYGYMPCEMHVHEAALMRDTPMRDEPTRWLMGDTRLWERCAYKRCTPVRGTPVRGMPLR